MTIIIVNVLINFEHVGVTLSRLIDGKHTLYYGYTQDDTWVGQGMNFVKR